MNERPTIDRREFISISTSSVILAASGLALSSEKPWYESMRRCGQINFNEKDPLTFDVNAWADYWAGLKVNAVLLNGGGIVAFYPTQIPYHHRSEFLGARDLFGEMVNAVKKRNLRAVARMDCNYSYEDALQAHPEWFERNRDGTPRRHNESTWLFKTCMFSPYFTVQMPAIYREISGRYPIDGFFTNGWPSTGGLGVCHCDNCRKIYASEVGGTPPEQADASNPLYRKYYEVYMARVLDIWRAWDATAREKNKESIYVGNLGGGIRTVKNLKRLADVAGWFNADHQGRSGDTPIWDCSQQGRVAQSVMQGRTITNVTGAYSNSRIIWRHTAKPPEETTLWMTQTAASGMVPWFHWLGGSPEDNRWRDVGRKFFNWLAAHETHFRNKRSLADLAVLYPQSTIAFYRMPSGRGAGDRPETVDYLQGLYHALLEGRFLFDFVHQDNLSAQLLRQYRALLIPNAAYLRDEECRQIRDYVAEGGSLLATFETSLYNEWGDGRKDFGLAEVFGASLDGKKVGPVGNSYARIERPHPVTAGFEGTALLPGAENRLPVRTNQNLPLVLSVVPAYPAFPPEMVFPRVARTEEPAAVFRTHGKSRIAYFAGDVDRSFWRSGNTDLLRLLVNAVRWTSGERQPPLTIEGEGIVELLAWETEAGFALHILNYTNPNMTRGFVHHLYPIGPQKVTLTIPARKITGVQALRLGRPLPFKQNGPSVEFEVPRVLDYEVIALT